MMEYWEAYVNWRLFTPLGKAWAIFGVALAIALAVRVFFLPLLDFFIKKSKLPIDHRLIGVFQNPISFFILAFGFWEAIHVFPVPAWLQALLFLIGSILLALVLRLFVVGFISRLAEKTETELDDRFVDAFKNPVAISVAAAGAWLSVKRLGTISYAENIHDILLSIVILFWVVAFLRFGGHLVDFASKDEHRYRVVTSRSKPIFHMLFKITVVLGAGYFIILTWGQDLTAWLASAGVAGVALGFAAKDTLANFISGIFIIADAPYKIGDYVVIDNGDRGRITDIGIRSTRMMTRDDVEVIVPNAIMGNSRIINQSGGPFENFRLRVKVSVAYGTDITCVREILMKAGADEPLVIRDPMHRVRFRSFGDSGLEFELLVWVENPELKGQAMDKLLDAIYREFSICDIEIPYPKRDVYLHTVTDTAALEASSSEEPTEKEA